MTVDEAIEIKLCTGDEFLHADPDKIDEADRISIEALKAVKSFRTGRPTPALWRLPGETKE